jgi:hypothetical protein
LNDPGRQFIELTGYQQVIFAYSRSGGSSNQFTCLIKTEGRMYRTGKKKKPGPVWSGHFPAINEYLSNAFLPDHKYIPCNHPYNGI